MFRLDKVLRWKERLERVAASELAALERRAAELDQAIVGTRAERDAFPDGAATMTVEELAEWSRYGEMLRKRESRIRERRRAMDAELETRRAAHQEARRDVAGLRKLKERWEHDRRKRRDRQGQESMDEAAARTKLPGGGRKFPFATTEAPAAEGENEPQPHLHAGETLKWGSDA